MHLHIPWEQQDRMPVVRWLQAVAMVDAIRAENEKHK